MHQILFQWWRALSKESLSSVLSTTCTVYDTATPMHSASTEIAWRPIWRGSAQRATLHVCNRTPLKQIGCTWSYSACKI
jgi:hypothetical protein